MLEFKKRKAKRTVIIMRLRFSKIQKIYALFIFSIYVANK